MLKSVVIFANDESSLTDDLLFSLNENLKIMFSLKTLFRSSFSSILSKSEKNQFEGVHLIKIPGNYLWTSWFVVKLRDTSLQVYKRQNSFSILFHVFFLHFLRTYHNYFYRRGFEIVPARFLSENINEK